MNKVFRSFILYPHSSLFLLLFGILLMILSFYLDFARLSDASLFYPVIAVKTLIWKFIESDKMGLIISLILYPFAFTLILLLFLLKSVQKKAKELILLINSRIEGFREKLFHIKAVYLLALMFFILIVTTYKLTNNRVQASIPLWLMVIILVFLFVTTLLLAIYYNKNHKRIKKDTSSKVIYLAISYGILTVITILAIVILLKARSFNIFVVVTGLILLIFVKDIFIFLVNYFPLIFNVMYLYFGQYVSFTKGFFEVIIGLILLSVILLSSYYFLRLKKLQSDVCFRANYIALNYSVSCVIYFLMILLILNQNGVSVLVGAYAALIGSAFILSGLSIAVYQRKKAFPDLFIPVSNEEKLKVPGLISLIQKKLSKQQ